MSWITKIKKERARRIVKNLKGYIETEKRILDVGCGGGYIAEEIKNRFQDIKIIGIDIISKPEANIEYIRYDGKIIPFREKEFDLGLLIFVLHHSNDPDSLITEVKRVAKKVIVIEDVYNSVLSYLMVVIMDFFTNLGKGSFRFKNIKKWEEFFSKHNLKVINKKVFKLYKLYPIFHCMFVLEPTN